MDWIKNKIIIIFSTILLLSLIGNGLLLFFLLKGKITIDKISNITTYSYKNSGYLSIGYIGRVNGKKWKIVSKKIDYSVTDTKKFNGELIKVYNSLTPIQYCFSKLIYYHQRNEYFVTYPEFSTTNKSDIGNVQITHKTL